MFVLVGDLTPRGPHRASRRTTGLFCQDLSPRFSFFRSAPDLPALTQPSVAGCGRGEGGRDHAQGRSRGERGGPVLAAEGAPEGARVCGDPGGVRQG